MFLFSFQIYYFLLIFFDILPYSNVCSLRHSTKLGDPLFKCNGGKPLEEDKLKLTIRRSRIVTGSVASTQRKRSSFLFKRPGGSASCSRNVYM